MAEIVKFKKTGIDEIDEFFEKMMEKVSFLGCGRNSKSIGTILEEKGIEYTEHRLDDEYTTRMIDGIPDQIEPKFGRELVWEIITKIYSYERDGELVSAVQVSGEDFGPDGDFYSVYRFEGHVSPDRYRVTRRMLNLHSLVMDRDNEIYNLYDLFKRMEEEEEHIRRRKNRLAKIVFGMARF